MAFADYFAVEAAHAIVRLARAGRIRQGLKAARELLRIERRSGASNGFSNGETLGFSPEPVGRLSDWEYKQATEKMLPDLVDSAGLKGLRLFAGLLNAAVEFSRHKDDPSDSDGYSWIWRPAIEDHPQNADSGVRCALVTAVRDAAVRLAGVSDEDLRAVLEVLEAGTAHLHHRIALHVLAVVPGGADLVAERIVNRTIFEEPRLKHEYAELLRHRLGEASSEVRRTFLDRVFEGPDLDEYRRRHSAAGPEDEVVYAENWKRDWLSIVADHLFSDDAEQYRELLAKHGEAHHPDFVSWTESGWWSATPLTAEDMNEMSVEAVIEYLATWEPDEDASQVFSPSMEGLGRTFEAAVPGRAGEFAAVANRIETLDPTYVRSFLSGLESAVKEGASVPWDQPIRLITSVLEHPFEHEDAKLGFERDPGWGWTRGQAASLIEEGVADRDNRIPFELRQEVWGVLEALARDPQPTPADENSAGSSSMNPLALSINMNRSKAMHAIVAYALWCRRELDVRGTGIAAGFELMPEVRTVLDERLDPSSEPSSAVRAVYGRWLPWLILLDKEWTAANITRILPSAPELAKLRNAAWNTYVGWCPPFNPVYEVLRHEYEAAVERVPSSGTVDVAGDERADAKLGEHLVTFHWRGCLQPRLLERWFERADDECAASVMDPLGRSLNNTQQDINPAVLQRIRELWDSRLEVIAGAPEAHQSEADAFAYTFVSAKLDDDWSLASLNITLRTGVPRWRGQPILGRLAEIAAAKPVEATRYTLRMLEGAANDWDHFSWRDQVRDVLIATNRVADPDTVDNRKAIVDHYVKHGNHEFKSFIQP